MNMSEENNKYHRFSKDMTPDKVQPYLNEKSEEGYKIIYYDERIMATDNVWITVLWEKIEGKSKKRFL